MQTCATCCGELKPNPEFGSGDVHHKICSKCHGHNGTPGLSVEKNISAALCLVRIFLHVVAKGQRPRAFLNPHTRPKVAGQKTRQST